MSKRMTSETVIFDTDWLTEADFGDNNYVVVSIDYQAYDTLKIIVDVLNLSLDKGGLFQEFEVYKIENNELSYRALLSIDDEEITLETNVYSKLNLTVNKSYWETYIKGLGSIYIKGVKR